MISKYITLTHVRLKEEEFMGDKTSLVHEERIINAKNGFLMLFVSTLLLAASIAMCILGPVLSGMDRISGGLCGFLIALGLVLFIVSIILYCGLKILNPNEALVFAPFLVNTMAH